MAVPSNAHLAVHGFVGYCRHEDVIAGVPTYINYIDFGLVNGFFGVFAWPTAKFPFPIALEPERGGTYAWGEIPMEGCGTDASIVVPHVPVKPVAVGFLFPLIVLLGSSKIIMASNRTRVWCRGLLLAGEEEQAVGCCVFPTIPISLNLQCWDFASKKLDQVSAPVMSDLVIAPNTVQVGVEFADYLAAGWAWAKEVILAFLIAFGSKAGKSWWAKHQQKSLQKAELKATKAREAARTVGMSEEDAVRVYNRVYKKETDSILPKWLKTPLDKILDKEGGTKYLSGLGTTVFYRLLIKNTDWYKDGEGMANDTFDRLADPEKLKCLAGMAAGIFGTEVHALVDVMGPLVRDAFGHGHDGDPSENYWGGLWQIYRAE